MTRVRFKFIDINCIKMHWNYIHQYFNSGSVTLTLGRSVYRREGNEIRNREWTEKWWGMGKIPWLCRITDWRKERKSGAGSCDRWRQHFPLPPVWEPHWSSDLAAGTISTTTVTRRTGSSASRRDRMYTFRPFRGFPIEWDRNAPTNETLESLVQTHKRMH